MRYLVAVLAALLGIGSIIVFTVFIYTGPFHLVVLPLNAIEPLLFDAFLAVLFCLQHSLMVRPWFKQKALTTMPAAYFGALFSIVSGVVLLLLMALWQESTVVIASITGGWRWVLRGLFFLVLLLQAWALWSLKSADLFGIEALVKPARARSDVILATGAYQWVRHPIYSTTLLLLWLYPDITADRLLLNLLLSVWIIIGAHYEERDLVRAHGYQYREYQRAVPMLVPRIKRF